MDSTDLAFFAAVARAGGITRAAVQLGTVQSNVTQRIQRLEQKLGVPLFYRHGRGMTLTSAGTRLLPYACSIEQTLDEAAKVAQEGAEPSGALLIGAMETTAALRLPQMLVQYAVDFPAVDITLRTGTSRDMCEAVLARTLDAALVAGPVSDPELLAEAVGMEELVIVTAPWVTLFGPASIWSSMTEMKMIVFRNGCSYRETLERFMLRRGVTRLRTMELGSLDAILGCVRAGIGITLLPRTMVEPLLADGSLRMQVLPDGAGRVATVCVRRRDSFISTALAAFLQRVRTRFEPIDDADMQVQAAFTASDGSVSGDRMHDGGV